MSQGKWKTLALLGCVAALASVLLALSLVSIASLPLTGWNGITPLVGLLLLTLIASRFKVSVTNADGVSQSEKSVADAFIFLAAMMYAVEPARSVGPAVLLAAVVGLISSWKSSDRRIAIFTTGAAIISTYAATSLYGFLVHVFLENSKGVTGIIKPESLLLPLCLLALVQYFLSTVATSAFIAFDAGKTRLTLSRESLVWTSITEIGSAASAALFYSALHNESIPFIFVGLLIIVMVYLLYRFDEQRVQEVRRAERDKAQHLREMADLHMNTIESLAIAIDAKDQTTHGHVRRTQIYASEMGKLFDVTPEQVQALFAGALLHDIGKLAVPEYILNKPGKLTEAEFAKMKIHPTVGGDILKRLTNSSTRKPFRNRFLLSKSTIARRPVRTPAWHPIFSELRTTSRDSDQLQKPSVKSSHFMRSHRRLARH